MTPNELELRLIRWGRAYGEARGDEWDEDASATGDSPLAHGLAYAPGSREVAVRRLASYDRAGLGRRLAMGAAAGMVTVERGVRPVPAWACDPIRAPRVRGGGGSGGSWDEGFTPDVERVQTAWLALRGFNLLQGECLRVQYQIRAMTQREKAELVGDDISPKRYKDELRMARVWMHARLSL